MASNESEKRVPVKSGRKEERKGETAITPWRPESYAADLDRAFDEFSRRFEAPFSGVPGFWLPRRRIFPDLPAVRYPSADIIDSGKEYRVLAEVPGIPKEKLEVTVTERGIKIDGEAKTDIREEKEGFVRRERGYSKISRSLAFPEPVVGEKAQATVTNGVLEVRVPKKTPTKVTRHKVTVK